MCRIPASQHFIVVPNNICPTLGIQYNKLHPIQYTSCCFSRTRASRTCWRIRTRMAVAAYTRHAHTAARTRHTHAAARTRYANAAVRTRHALATACKRYAHSAARTQARIHCCTYTRHALTATCTPDTHTQEHVRTALIRCNTYTLLE